ncbi:ABC transporter ATP-binding protein [Geodermatophilus sp. DSM 44513]|uniref:ABC transporter ATP-binding protein n=1 Tax=Geodermatophilus sp. DSM 44513 TaxID=1528104 RepID=UPI00126C297F|nr:ABC transporter ATP-binding protein [Geodermatophilus sp. DSM 44513]WNV77642.1 ABC transporter ATP-binding protein [Geodermatophilus sp. DSM 44513]
MSAPPTAPGPQAPEPAAHPLPVADGPRTRAAAGRLLRPHRGALGVATVVLVAATGVTLAGPALLGRIVDAAVAGRGELLGPLAAAFLAATVAGAALSWWGTVRMATAAERVLADLRRHTLTRALQVPLSTLERAGTGDLVSRVTADVAVLSSTVRTAGPSSVLATLEIALTLGALALLSPPLLPAVLAGAPVVVLGGRWYARHAPARYREERARVGRLMGGLHESAAGLRTVLAFRRSAAQRVRIGADADAVYDAAMSTARARNVLRPAVTAGQVVALVTTLALGTVLVGRDAATVGVVTAAALYQIRLLDPVGTLLELLDELQSASAALRRLVGIEDAAVPPGPAAGTPAGSAILVEGVRFGYAGGPEVLHGVDLAVAPGERLAVVGPSGAGKTTLGALVAGVHRPDAGRVLVGGVPVTDLGNALPATVVLVTQETHVFRGTLVEDLRLAAPDAGDADLDRALAAVGASGWVAALPAGPATRIGDGGLRLSPTQAQQVALARLLLRDPRVVVLDEATAALDPTAARGLERALEAALRGRTVLAVSHRLDVAAGADRIAVVEDGRVTEVGSHTELLAAGGGYAELWHAWHGARGGPASRRG